jgi:hypothetical protein
MVAALVAVEDSAEVATEAAAAGGTGFTRPA